MTEEMDRLAEAILRRGLLPRKAEADAFHIALAKLHQAEILMTWNCKHMGNVHIYKQISRFAAEIGYNVPMMCTPTHLLGGTSWPTK